MIKRDVTSFLDYTAGKYPVITITGPRQSGKTTLAKEFFKDYEYVNLESLRERTFAQNDPEKFLSRYPDGVIIDEVQHVPELTSYIQVIVDERKKDAMFVLTGSRNFSLIKSVSQSLSGRTSIIELLPLSYKELLKSKYIKSFLQKKKNVQIKMKNEKFQIDKLMYSGLFPRIYDKDINPTVYYGDYTKTYIERDLREIKEIKNVNSFRKFLSLCAARSGQILNLSNIASDVGVSSVTLREWVSILEASYIIFLIKPFYGNINKQLVKSPKLYFTDTGLICYLLGIDSPQLLQDHPLRGNIFENLIVSEVLKFRLNQGRGVNIDFFKDKYKEIDLLYKQSNKFVACEIKSSETINEEFFIGLDYIEKLFPKQLKSRVIIYGGTESYEMNKTRIVNLQNLTDYLEEI
ncbi:MAG: ATP-binding protein [Candidatus Melainabacteria bacterium]|nr:ATP-binding protein [Candidatus Melainabacteria bacterium]